MKKPVLFISLFLLGAIFSIKAQEMTQKEKNSYVIGVILGEKIKEANIDISVLESIEEEMNKKIDFESVRVGIKDNLKGESKLSKEDIETILAELAKELEKEKDNLAKIFNANQNNGNERETERPESAVARTLGTLSWYYLFTKDYKKSEQSANQALKLDITQTWVKTNLAHALLFRNRFSKAEKIYKELSLIKRNEKFTYKQILLEDFEALEKAGVIPEKQKDNVEKIKKMLRE